MAVLVVLAAMFIVMAAGCGEKPAFPAEGKVNVVASFYPLYDFAVKIGGDRVNVIQLVPVGVEPHDWTPKIKDMENVLKADVFLYNGAGFEGWVDAILSQIDSSRTIAAEGSHGVDLIRAGDRGEDEHDGGDHDEEAHGHDEDARGEHEGAAHKHGDADPHIWTSPLQAQAMAANIRDALIQADPDYAKEYADRYEALIERLQALDAELRAIIAEAPKREIIVSHDAFAYVARDYGLRQLPVMGLSPEAEPTVQKLKEVHEFAREHDIQYILFEELASAKVAETLAGDLGIGTLVLNPLEGLTEEQQKAGEDYFSLMESNLTSIRKALY